jgi:predicted nucleic acid-binding protein
MELIDTDVLIDVQRGFSAAADWFATDPDFGIPGFVVMEGLGLLDALIAATAVGHGGVLNTFNERHYRMFPGLTTVRPYQR